MDDMHVDAGTAMTFSRMLLVNTALKILGFNKCQIDSDGAHELAVGIQKNVGLTTLKLGNNKIGDRGVEAIAHALATNTNSNINHLNFEALPIHYPALYALADMLNVNQKVTIMMVKWLHHHTHGHLEVLSHFPPTSIPPLFSPESDALHVHAPLL